MNDGPQRRLAIASAIVPAFFIVNVDWEWPAPESGKTQELVHRLTLANQDDPDDKEPDQRWEVGDDCGTPASRVVEPRCVCWAREHRRNGQRAQHGTDQGSTRPAREDTAVQRGPARCSHEQAVIANAIDPL